VRSSEVDGFLTVKGFARVQLLKYVNARQAYVNRTFV
jgi:hypothetical protein